LFDDEGRAVMIFRSKHGETQREGERTFDEFEGVEVDLFQPETGSDEPQVRLSAASARIERTGQTADFQPEYAQRIPMRDVRVELLTGSPLAPLTLELPNALLDATPGSRRLSSDDPVDLRSAQLSVQGHGFLLELDESWMRFDHDSEIRVVQEGRPPAVLSCSGPLRILREAEEGPHTVTLDLREGARLTYPAEPPWTLSARRMGIVGEEVESAEGTAFVVRRAGAFDDVVWTANESEFRGERARISFDAEGQAALARLEGFPTASIRLDQEVPGAPGLEPAEAIRVRGERHLDLSWDEGVGFDMAGPSTIDVAGATLRCLDGVEGRRDDAAGTAWCKARGGVVLEVEDATLETAELEVDVLGASDLRATARGGARITGRLEDGRDFALTSPEHITVSSAAGAWQVVEATDVLLSVEGEEPLTARADRVTRFDPAGPTLRAEGDVELQGPAGRSTGQRLELDPGRIRLVGTPDEPAHYESAEVTADASTIEAEENRLSARGDVRATVRPSPDAVDESYGLRCEEMDVERAEERSVDRLDRSFRLAARGDVVARISVEGDTSVVRGETLAGSRSELWTVDDEPQLVGARSEVTVEGAAGGAVTGTLRMPGSAVNVEGKRLVIQRSEGGSDGVAHTAEVVGDVRFAMALDRPDAEELRRIRLRGEGQRLTLDHLLNGSLEPGPGGRIAVRGELPSHRIPFELFADRFDLIEGARFEAVHPELLVGQLDEEPAPGLSGLRATAQRMIVGESALELVDDVHLRTLTPSGVPWAFRAGRVLFEARAPNGEVAASPELRGVYATGGVTFEMGTRDDPDQIVARAHGETLVARSIFEPMRLTGLPARVETEVFVNESEWIEFDPDLQIVVATGRGRMVPNPKLTETEEVKDEWSLSYESSRTFTEPDSLIYVLREPFVQSKSEQTSLRSSWAVFWLDRREWSKMPGKLAEEAPTTPTEVLEEEARAPAPDEPASIRARLFGLFAETDFANLLRETYFEGPVEVQREGELLARADAIYLDVVAGHGWLANATIVVRGSAIGQDFEKVIVKAAWLRHSSDNSLQANEATVTPCDYEKPHVRIVTGKLKIKPEGKNYAISLRNNRIEMYDMITLPLPPIAWSSDERGRPVWESLRAGDSGRFGPFLKAGVVRPAGGLGKGLNGLLGGNPLDYDAHYKIDASYLGSRGVLLDLGLELESKDDYWFNLYVGGVPDDGEDRGYIRVPEDDRDRLRLWYRANGRWNVSESQRVNLEFSSQTDAAVQSEFFESDFERYERRQSYVQYTASFGRSFVEAAVEPRVDSFRTEVEELPSSALTQGRSTLFSLGSFDFVHSGRVAVDNLQRREGDPGVQSPFGYPDVFPDGLGDRDVLRVDVEQALEAPTEVGVAGLRFTPFVVSRLTAWDEAATLEDRTPLRFVTEAGARLATAFWRRGSAGALYQLAPFLGWRRDIALQEEGGDPVTFDEVEGPVEGHFLDVGLRGRFGIDATGEQALDVEARATYGSDLPDGQPDGWMPFQVFAGLDWALAGVPLQAWHEGRYDVRTGDTPYSLTAVAARFTEDLRFEAGHRKGDTLLRDPDTMVLDVTRYEAATLAAIYRWTDKWEFEGEQTFSLTANDVLDSKLILRRYGHDFVFEIETGVRQGEGGPSFGIGFKPRFGWKPSRLGFLSY